MKISAKKLFIVLIIVLIIVIVVTSILVLKLNQKNNIESPSEYAAVYLSTGDIYFGKINKFPHLSLENVWYLQRGVDAQNQAQMSVVPLKNSFWGPVDKINLNSKQVVWWTYIKNGSQLLEAFKNLNMQNQSNQTQNLDNINTNNGQTIQNENSPLPISGTTTNTSNLNPVNQP